MAVAGGLIEATYNHPDLGTGTLFFMSNEDSTFDTGGYRADDDADAVDGGGNMIDKMTNKRWKLEGTISWDLTKGEDLNELSLLSALAGSPKPSEWTISHISGITYGGTGKPVGDYSGNGGAASISVILSGGGRLRQIG